jgi:hypothetical protein
MYLMQCDAMHTEHAVIDRAASEAAANSSQAVSAIAPLVLQ